MTSPQRLFWLCSVSITVQKEGNTLIYVKTQIIPTDQS